MTARWALARTKPLGGERGEVAPAEDTRPVEVNLHLHEQPVPPLWTWRSALAVLLLLTGIFVAGYLGGAAWSELRHDYQIVQTVDGPRVVSEP